MKYKRILLKLSGETLKGKFDHGYDAEAVRNAVGRIKPLVDQGLEVAIVVGAGNIWRGVMGANTGMDPVTCDYMGMLGTIINAVAIKSTLENNGLKSQVLSAIEVKPIAKQFLLCYYSHKWNKLCKQTQNSRNWLKHTSYNCHAR